jgi:NADH-quinone oxidoreductase subunit N
MNERLAFLWPEIALFVTTCLVMVVGLSPKLATRKLAAVIAGLGLAVAGVLAATTTPDLSSITLASLSAAEGSAQAKLSGQILLPGMVVYAKVTIAVVGLLLLLLVAGTVDRVDEVEIAAGKRRFDPIRSNRAEFYAFFLFSLTGLMLCASADDLIWLFLALELTSLPTYIMVTISTARNKSREAGVKYFFLGALGAAIFLYGFALIFGGTGSTNLNEIALHWRTHGIDTISMMGVLLSIIGLAFKIAAIPMHFYTPDVYEGSAGPVAAFLAFVPKTAGFISLILLSAAVGWVYAPGVMNISLGTAAEPLRPAMTNDAQLPDLIHILLWVMAALTMTVGNVLAVLQTNLKRILGYSSIAHSGYMLVGILVGPGDGTFTGSGISAVLFYLLSYGIMSTGAFAAIAAIERRPDADGHPREVEHVSDLRGLWQRQPHLAIAMILCNLSLLGLPPLLGFFGKLPLFTSAISAGEIVLVVVLGLNSAIAAFYYLRLAFVPFVEDAEAGAEAVALTPFRSREIVAMICAGGVIVLALAGGPLLTQVTNAARVSPNFAEPQQRPATLSEPVRSDNAPAPLGE